MRHQQNWFLYSLRQWMFSRRPTTVTRVEYTFRERQVRNSYCRVCIRWNTRRVRHLNSVVHTQKFMNCDQTFFQKSTACTTSLARWRLPQLGFVIGIRLVSHGHYALLLLLKHFFLYFLFDAFSIFKSEGRCRGGNKLVPEQNRIAERKMWAWPSNLRYSVYISTVSTILYFLEYLYFDSRRSSSRHKF